MTVREDIVQFLIGYYGSDIDIGSGHYVEQDAADDLIALLGNHGVSLPESDTASD